MHNFYLNCNYYICKIIFNPLVEAQNISKCDCVTETLWKYFKTINSNMLGVGIEIEVNCKIRPNYLDVKSSKRKLFTESRSVFIFRCNLIRHCTTTSHKSFNFSININPTYLTLHCLHLWSLQLFTILRDTHNDFQPISFHICSTLLHISIVEDTEFMCVTIFFSLLLEIVARPR